MGQRRLTLKDGAFLEIFQAGPHPAYQITRDPIPSDATIVDVVHSPMEGVLFVWMEHPSWNEPTAVLAPELQLLLLSEIAVPIPVRTQPRCRCGRGLIDGWCEGCTMDASTCDCVGQNAGEEIPDGWDESDVGIEVLRLRGLTVDGPAVG